MLDLQQVHLLSDGLRRGAMRANPEPDVADPFALAAGRTVPQQPLVFRQFMGRRVYDLVGTGYAPLILVSQRSSMRLRGPMHGWSTFPIELIDGSGKPVPGYLG